MAFQRALAENAAKEARRRQQQGLGRPIISTEFAGHRIVAVGDTVHWSRQWTTFHDFLFDYIKQAFGVEWGSKEQQKPVGERHILLRWAYEIEQYGAATRAKMPNAKVLSAPATPVLSAYLNLAHNLYLMKHNAKLQRRLIGRLKNPDESSFHGAYYETFVAATFIKAGYEIDFENEQDGAVTHCEFVASCPARTQTFSVEAKARYRGLLAPDTDPKNLKLGVRDKVDAALQKKADHTRVIFIDVNLPEAPAEDQRPFWVDAAVAEVRDHESTMAVSGQEMPTAYIIITNSPYQFAGPTRLSAVIEGFNISELKIDRGPVDLRTALDVRARHAEILQVFESMQRYNQVPSTFDAEMPETHFLPAEEKLPPLKIGQTYLVPGADGIEFPAELENAIVLESERSACGVYRRLSDNCRIIANCPMTDAELEAYRTHPSTFFGTVDENAGRKCEHILDWYDFFFASYGNTSREQLLEFMKDAGDIDRLKMMSQEELAKTYCERLAYGVEYQSKKRSPDEVGRNPGTT